MVTLEYNTNSKQISASGADVTQSTETNIDQINVLTTSLIGETNPNFTPQPNEALSKMIKGLFESGMKNLQQKKLNEALKNVSLAIEMAQRKRAPWEAFAIQLPELHFMLRSKIDLSLVLGKYLEALQDLDFLLGTGLIQPDVFVRKADCLLKLGQWEEARATLERGLAFVPDDMKLRALLIETARNLAEYNGE
ncbi:Sec63 complex subunit SEC72 [Saccharomyces eubayanus]|uniref:Sec63 complex subunit SEC72 n=1 Tax=Saccharomyces eubayanus TaxID=1080349 RepID=UPI0006C70A8A|nr:SEC72-like protein [Saccharomyces eubayanus]KOG97977.1 SEC72-like protein [Saccharomyces eubayanus]